MLGMLMLWPRASRAGQMFILALMPLYAWGIYSTFTRSAWLGLVLGLMVVLSLTLPKIWRNVVIGTLVVASLPIVALNWEQLLSFKRDKELSAAEAAESAKLRPILAVVAWHMFLDRPVFGSGYGQYGVASKPYLSDRSTDLPLEKARPYVQHNAFLALLVDTGLVGMGLFYRARWSCGCGWPGACGARRWRCRRLGSSACCSLLSSASGFPTRCSKTC